MDNRKWREAHSDPQVLSERDELLAALEMLATMCALPASNQQAHFISSGEHMTRYRNMRAFIASAVAAAKGSGRETP